LIQWHTFTDYGDLYIEDYDFLGDLFIEVFPEGVYIYAPYGVWKVTGSVPVVTSSTTTTTHYSLSNDKVIYETDGTYEIYYTYDYDGTLISFNYDNNINDAIVGNEYFYIKNQQGDITALVNSQGIIQVEYRYDAWGNIIYINTPSGSTLDPSINPYTYRGYRYDGEIGFYYCNSRYYNPEWGRWLNADSVNYLDPSSTNGFNLYAYCGNNPVIKSDVDGNVAWWIIGAAIGAVVGAVVGGIVSYNQTGKVDVGYVLAFAAGGALVGAGLGCLAEAVYTSVTITTAATNIVGGGTGAIGAICADGDPTNEIDQTSQTINSAIEIIKQGTKIGKNIITQIDEKTKILFRIDSHPIKPMYIEPISHINIEIQVLNSAGNWATKWNMHIILDEAGEVLERIITGPWA
jgi:RHS repeat-associated protein